MSRFTLYTVYLLLPVGALAYIAPDLSWSLASRALCAIVVAASIAWGTSGISSRTRRVAVAWTIATGVYLVEVAELFVYFLTGDTFGRSFFYHLRFDVVATGASAFGHFGLVAALPAIVVAAIDWHVTEYRHRSRRPVARFAGWAMVALLCLGLTDNAGRALWQRYGEFTSVAEASPAEVRHLSNRLGIDISFVGRDNVTATQSADSKNLILLYLESVERSYLDETRFPGLLPNIREALHESIDFTDLRQTPGTEWTMAGMFASQCSMPLLAGGKSNDQQYANNGLDTLICLGDLLHTAGYHQVYMGGASLDFAGKGHFYRNHGFDEVLGLTELRDEISANSALSQWGLYDDSLFGLLLRKIDRLSNQSRPFAVTALTLDTHAPNGMPSNECPNYRQANNSMLNAVHCTDHLFGQFIDELERLPSYQDTVVLVMSDHLALRNVASELYPPERRLLAFALNAGKPGPVHRQGTHFDVLPTLLDALGIETTYSPPLGSSLLAPGSTPDLIDFHAPYVQSVLRGLLLSLNATRDLCSHRGFQVVDRAEAKVAISDQTSTLSYNGVPRLPDQELALMVPLTETGAARFTELVEIGEMRRRLDTAPDAPYLIVASVTAFPQTPRVSQSQNGMALFLGRWGQPEAALFRVFSSIEAVRLPEDSCPVTQFL